MTSDIAGTTRDTVEAMCNIDGVVFRFIDTAGLRNTDDKLEQMGIDRTHRALEQAQIVVQMVDADRTEGVESLSLRDDQMLIRVVNKIDTCADVAACRSAMPEDTLYISAKSGEGVEKLIEMFKSITNASAAYQGEVIVSSQRHYEALTQASEALHSALTALDTGISSDLLSEDIRQVMYHLGGITGEITNSEILQSFTPSALTSK